METPLPQVDDYLTVLRRYCLAMSINDVETITLVQEDAYAVGIMLYRNGGLSEMVAAISQLAGLPSIMELSMLWDGIGEWKF